MQNIRVATVYTTPSDNWANLAERTGLGREALVALNPHVEALDELEPGIPLDVPAEARRSFAFAARARGVADPYAVAREELLLNVAENPRPGQDHPRIRLYHSTTSGGAEPDEVSWCSSFVNYCAEKAGLTGTDSKAARSWLRWGSAVDRDDWREGDIIVFWRESPNSWKGHVGFLVDWAGPRPTVLAGNQSNRLSISTAYPFSAILSVRRAG
ncbi:MAG TPA: TIGR02594 family protein [Allosphingosinicella sp.]|nr:TIGR02594 family protein [Allosphingosinicella sp.]